MEAGFSQIQSHIVIFLCTENLQHVFVPYIIQNISMKLLWYVYVCALTGTSIWPTAPVTKLYCTCVESNRIFNYTTEAFITSEPGIVILDAVWKRDGANLTNSTTCHIPVQPYCGLGLVVTCFMVDNTMMCDNGTLCTCTVGDIANDFTSTNVLLNIVGGEHVCLLYMMECMHI